jgi:hypothetical protein
LISANKYIPRIEYIIMIRRRRLPILAMAGKVMKKVITVPLRVLFPLKKKRIRAMRKDFIIVI